MGWRKTFWQDAACKGEKPSISPCNRRRDPARVCSGTCSGSSQCSSRQTKDDVQASVSWVRHTEKQGGKTYWHFHGAVKSPILFELREVQEMRGVEWAETGSESLDSMPRSLHSTLWTTGNYWKVTVRAAEDSLDRGQKRGRKTLEGLLQDEWMNRDKWMII